MSNDLREVLSQLHVKACEALSHKLDDPENITAAELNAVLGFLKHNGITALPVAGSPLRELADKMESLDKFPFAVSGSILPEDDPAVAGAPGVLKKAGLA